ncbi:MAG: hypothetical protein HUJ63_09235, partial [Enterococcus sp.]|nr:hypothetical protein [Enterococcus sp.]
MKKKGNLWVRVLARIMAVVLVLGCLNLTAFQTVVTSAAVGDEKKVTVTVYDARLTPKEPVYGAKVTFAENSGTPIEAEDNNDGTYTATLKEGTTYNYTVKKIGLEEKKSSITVGVADNDFVVDLDKIQFFETITVYVYGKDETEPIKNAIVEIAGILALNIDDGYYSAVISSKKIVEGSEYSLKINALGYEEVNTISTKTEPKVSLSPPQVNLFTDIEAGSYYNTSQTATIKIVSGNFSTSSAGPIITGPETGYSFSGWAAKVGEEDTYEGIITFSDDGKYKMEYTCVSESGIPAETIEIGDFTIDRTAPKITISGVEAGETYTNPTVKVQVEEKNFDKTCKKPVVTQENGNNDYTISEWKSRTDGVDGYECDVTFQKDGKYKIAFNKNDCIDLAGNTAENTAEIDWFTVDKTAPIVTVSYVYDDGTEETFDAGSAPESPTYINK